MTSYISSHPSRVRGLKQLSKPNENIQMFAPITGAWIETFAQRLIDKYINSHPSRVRGLKQATSRVADSFYIRTHHGCMD